MVGETFVSKSALTKRLKVGTRGIYVPLPLPRRKRDVVGQLVLEQITSATTVRVKMRDKYEAVQTSGTSYLSHIGPASSSKSLNVRA